MLGWASLPINHFKKSVRATIAVDSICNRMVSIYIKSDPYILLEAQTAVLYSTKDGAKSSHRIAESNISVKEKMLYGFKNLRSAESANIYDFGSMRMMDKHLGTGRLSIRAMFLSKREIFASAMWKTVWYMLLGWDVWTLRSAQVNVYHYRYLRKRSPLKFWLLSI